MVLVWNRQTALVTGHTTVEKVHTQIVVSYLYETKCFNQDNSLEKSSSALGTEELGAVDHCSSYIHMAYDLFIWQVFYIVLKNILLVHWRPSLLWEEPKKYLGWGETQDHPQVVARLKSGN